LAFFTLWRLFEPENENPLVKWDEKFFSKLYYALEDCGTWVNKQNGMNNTESKTRETKHVELAAMNAVMNTERDLGFLPLDISKENRGYDIESRDPDGKTRLRFIEVKGRASGADVVTMTKNEILTALNKPEQFILALVDVDGDHAEKITYIRNPFTKEPDFGVTSVNYKIADLLAKGEKPQK